MKINCIYYNRGFCENKLIKRSLFGIGPRICSETPLYPNNCPYQEKSRKPKLKLKGQRRK